MPQQLRDEFGLAAEVVVDGALGHPCGVGDLVHGDVGGSALADELHGRVEELLPGSGGVLRLCLVPRPASSRGAASCGAAWSTRSGPAAGVADIHGWTGPCLREGTDCCYDGERPPGVGRHLAQLRQPVVFVPAVPVRRVQYQQVGVGIGKGQGGEELKPPARIRLLSPEARDVREAVDLEPGAAQQRPPVAARDKGQVLRRQVADAQVLLGFIDAWGVHQRAGKLQLADAPVAVPAELPLLAFILPLRTRARAVR